MALLLSQLSVGGDLSLALSGQASTSAHGLLVPSHDVLQTGQAGTAEAGSVDNATDSALLGSLFVGATGTLLVQSDVLAIGAESTGATGFLIQGTVLVGAVAVASAGDVSPSGGAETDDLFSIQRQRRFGRISTPLARSRFSRKVR